jgi:uncharacterized protein (TIGR02145 family)
MILVDDVDIASLNCSNCTYNWNTSEDSPGDHTIKATAIDDEGATASAECTIELLGSEPTVQTIEVTSILSTSGSGGGVILKTGGVEILDCGVCWSTEHEPDKSDDHTSNNQGSSEFECQLTGLSPNTIYYFRAYAENEYGISYGNEKAFLTYPPDSVEDIDGNWYNTVTIGTQVWMAENLKTTRYNDGEKIPLVEDGNKWTTLNTAAYCWYENDKSKYDTLGALYNYWVTQSDKLCPTGWHVSSVAEWDAMIDYLGGEKVTISSTRVEVPIVGPKMRESGGLWTDSCPHATNSSGFTALPAGVRSHVDGGVYYFLGHAAVFWTSSVRVFALFCYLGYDENTGDNRRHGEQVRCIKDQ